MIRARARACACVLAEFLWKADFPSKSAQSAHEIYQKQCHSASGSSSSTVASVMSNGGDSSMLQEAFDDNTYRKLLNLQAQFPSSKTAKTLGTKSYYSIQVVVTKTALLENLKLLLGKFIFLVALSFLSM